MQVLTYADVCRCARPRAERALVSRTRCRYSVLLAFSSTKVQTLTQKAAQDVLEYNIALLRLLRILSLDVGPGDQKLLRSLFEPERMVQDVRGSVCLRRAKAQVLVRYCRT